MTVQYVIRRGVEDNVDYNQDGKIDAMDDVVIKYEDGVEVGRKFINQRTANKMKQVLAKSPKKEAVKTRVVYQRAPHGENAPPLVIKNETSFGHYVKAGAGMELGATAMDGVIGVVGSLFE